MKRILKCKKCSAYTMKETHCDEPTISPKPLRYHPGRFAKHRRQARKEELAKRGLH